MSVQDIFSLEGIAVRIVVEDEQNNPIDHIKVTLNHESFESPYISYTSSRGRMNTILDIPDDEFPIIIDIMIEDTDGEENGGQFESVSDRISILEDDGEPDKVISATYCLTLSSSGSDNQTQ